MFVLAFNSFRSSVEMNDIEVTTLDNYVQIDRSDNSQSYGSYDELSDRNCGTEVAVVIESGGPRDRSDRYKTNKVELVNNNNNSVNHNSYKNGIGI